MLLVCFSFWSLGNLTALQTLDLNFNKDLTISFLGYNRFGVIIPLYLFNQCRLIDSPNNATL